eukprot:CAMPEP_0182539588 /NCGR_PEP_ID=MMETSP1323-20130603/25646_1 /TAXON_ID=236787 /ORGANISM="Florenciella parvula, Strain RCC1693" /LENGTH=306 /DNA_ID=CAMNT_0024750165 /DNA_START=48 /DNA_END=968 /DNA_ORIENTATION=+
MARLLNLNRMRRAIPSFEDHFSVEELDEKLTTLGVISALMLSFVVGLFPPTPMASMIQGDYHMALFYNPDHDGVGPWAQEKGETDTFRLYMLAYLRTTGFNLTQLVGVDTYLNIEEVLQWVDGGDWLGGDLSVDQMWDLEKTFHLTKDVDGVLARSAAYLKGGMVSSWIIHQGGLAMTLLSFVLVASVTLSLALSMSQCKFESQKGNSVPIQRFSKIYVPFLILLYATTLTGAIWFFVATANIYTLESVTFLAQGQIILMEVAGMVPLLVISMLVGVATLCWANKAALAPVETNEPNKDATKDEDL